MSSIGMGDKIELTALQLLYLLSDTIEAVFERAEEGGELDPMAIAKEKTIEVFNRKREKGGEA